MAVRTILLYPDEKLRIKAKPVTNIDAEIKAYIDDLFETMYYGDAFGLAASQVNIHHRIFVMDSSQKRNNPQCLINPEIVEKEGSATGLEGCMSFPGAFAKIKRAKKVKVKALNEKGEPIEIVSEGEYETACLQHELDHLDGILMVDHLEGFKRKRFLEKYRKFNRLNI